VFDIAAEHASDAAAGTVDPRLELILRDQLELHYRILGIKSHKDSVRSYPTSFSDVKHFFVGQEHVMSDLKDILSIRQFEEGGKNSKVLVLVFAGVSGTGKTMLTELIANVIHGESIEELMSQGKYFRQDMGTWRNPEDSDALFGTKQASRLAFPAALY
jgi:hypothetical protein